MKTTRLFRNIWRVNAVIIFGAGVLVLVLGGIAAYYVLKDMRNGNLGLVYDTETAESIAETLSLGTAHQVGGHPWLLVPLQADHHGEIGSYSDDPSAVRNYAFVSSSLEQHWLYPHSRFLIVNATQLPRGAYDEESDATVAVSFEVVQKDTDGDQALTRLDSRSVVFTRPDGTGATTVLEDVSKVVSQELMGAEILVIYRDRDGYAAATLSTKDFSPVKRERLAVPPVGS